MIVGAIDAENRRERRVEQLGRYTILGDLGVGGMGSVRLGRAKCGRLVVLKRALHNAKDLEQRLVDEARIGFRLQHANIVETLDLFYDDGHPILVIAYVPGASLFELRRRRALPLASIARIGRQVADALHAIHTATNEYEQPLSIVHRDVTPANIMVGHDGDARLIDLGIARSTETHACRTATGFLRGTLRYLAPELYGDGKHSPSTDLWSLGLCILEAALGRRAIVGGDAAAVGKIVAWDGLRLQPNERLDPRLHDILHVLLQRDPAKRVDCAAQAAKMFARLEAQFAGAQRVASEFVAEVIGPPDAFPTSSEVTETFVRGASSTFCGASSAYADVSGAYDAETEGFENVFVDDGAPPTKAPSLADLYADSRAKIATPSRQPANDNNHDNNSDVFPVDVATVILDGIHDSGDRDQLGRGARDRALLEIIDDDNHQKVIVGSIDANGPREVGAAGFLAQWPLAQTGLGATPSSDDDDDRPKPTKPERHRVLVSSLLAVQDEASETKMLTPSRPVAVAASGEILPVERENARHRIARACGFPDPPHTPADELKSYVASLRGLEALDWDKPL